LLAFLGADFVVVLLTAFDAPLAGVLLGAFAGCREELAADRPDAARLGAPPGLGLADADALVAFLAGAAVALPAFFTGLLAAMSGVPPGDVNAGLYRLGPGMGAINSRR
jgi:hypothetical protein